MEFVNQRQHLRTLLHLQNVIERVVLLLCGTLRKPFTCVC